MYDEDSAADHDNLFLTIVNKSNGELFQGSPEIRIL